MRLRGCAGSPEHSLVAYAISTIISCASSNMFKPKAGYEITIVSTKRFLIRNVCGSKESKKRNEMTEMVL